MSLVSERQRYAVCGGSEPSLSRYHVSRNVSIQWDEAPVGVNILSSLHFLRSVPTPLLGLLGLLHFLPGSSWCNNTILSSLSTQTTTSSFPLPSLKLFFYFNLNFYIYFPYLNDFIKLTKRPRQPPTPHSNRLPMDLFASTSSPFKIIFLDNRMLLPQALMEVLEYIYLHLQSPPSSVNNPSPTKIIHNPLRHHSLSWLKFIHLLRPSLSSCCWALLILHFRSFISPRMYPIYCGKKKDP